MHFSPPPPLSELEVKATGVESPAQRYHKFETQLRGQKLCIDTIRRYARTGIPDGLRSRYWMLMLGNLSITPAEWAGIIERQTAQFNDMLKHATELDEEGNILAKNDANRIDVDIPRTMPDLDFFSCETTQMHHGVPITFSHPQQSLRRVLYCYANVNRGHRYTQGLNEIAALLLMTFAEDRKEKLDRAVEAQAFFALQRLVSLVGDNYLRVLDKDPDAGVSHTLINFELLFEFCDPALFAHLTGQGVQSVFYAFRWITLLFTQEFCPPDARIIWDFLLSYTEAGLEYAILYMCVAMLVYQREALLNMSNGLAEPLMLLQAYPSCDVGDLVKLAQRLITEYDIDCVARLREKQQTSSSDKYSDKAMMAAETATTLAKKGTKWIKGKSSNVMCKMNSLFRNKGSRDKSPGQDRQAQLGLTSDDDNSAKHSKTATSHDQAKDITPSEEKAKEPSAPHSQCSS